MDSHFELILDSQHGFDDLETIIKWQHFQAFKATWEWVDTINKYFSTFHLVNKVELLEGGVLLGPTVGLISCLLITDEGEIQVLMD